MSRNKKPTPTEREQRREHYNKDYLRDAIAFGSIAVLNFIQIVVFLVYFALQH